MNADFFQARLLYLRQLIDDELGGQRVVPKGFLDDAVRRLSQPFGMNEAEIVKCSR